MEANDEQAMRERHRRSAAMVSGQRTHPTRSRLLGWDEQDLRYVVAVLYRLGSPITPDAVALLLAGPDRVVTASDRGEVESSLADLEGEGLLRRWTLATDGAVHPGAAVAFAPTDDGIAAFTLEG